MALRSGVSVDDVVRQLNGITCCPIWDSGRMVRSAPDAVALVLEQYANKDRVVSSSRNGHQNGYGCMECGSQTVIHEEGCVKCTSCGASKCG